MLGCVYLSNTTKVVLDKYTHPNIFIGKHNGDDKPHGHMQYKDKDIKSNYSEKLHTILHMQ